MRIIDVAIKDLVHSARSVFLLVFALVLPLLTTAVFFAAFGGMKEPASNAMPAIPVAVTNLDANGASAAMFLTVLESAPMRGTLAVTRLEDATLARAGVAEGKFAAAVIIPRGFSDALASGEESTAMEIVQDPTKTAGPAVVRAIVGQIVDGLAGARISMQAVGAAYAAHRLPTNSALWQQIGAGYGAWAAGLADPNNNSAWTVVPVSQTEAASSGFSFARMVSTIMGMMLVFYCFFTGIMAAQTILREQEDGTLQRLFTTPAARTSILVGKALAVGATVFLELIVLIAVSRAAFGIAWGTLGNVTLAILGTGALSTSFAVLLTSFMSNMKQAGMVNGMVANVVGWIGISRMFSGIIPSMSSVAPITNTVSLLSPHGWAAWIWQASLAGEAVLPIFAGMIALSLVMFLVGAWCFQQRFN